MFIKAYPFFPLKYCNFYFMALTFIRLFACIVFFFNAVLIVGVPFMFSVKGRMWNSIVTVPDHCLLSTLVHMNLSFEIEDIAF